MLKQKSVLMYLMAALATSTTACSMLQKKPKPIVKTAITAIDPAKKTADSLKKATGLKPYDEVIVKGTKTQTGFIKVHQKDNKYYFEIPDSVLGRDILTVNRVSKAASDMRNRSDGYAGDQIGENIYQFEKGPNNKLFLRRISFSEYSPDSTTTMFASVAKNNISGIAAAFPIVAKSKDSSAVVIDVTDFLNADNDVIYFSKKQFKDRAGIAAQQNDRSYVDYVRAYQKNVEIGAVKTYSAGANPSASSYTLGLNSSLLLLDKKPMRPRIFDPRVGYFNTSYKDFDADPQGVATTNYANRWKLEPKPEDVNKYLNGELVEPAKQIIFYIDPVTPKKWVKYLMQGVDDWQKAFEAAGFKNAILAKEAPTKEQDSTWSIDDARHSAIIYRPSAVANAMGPSVADPRSGEIIESHIFWYHNVMSLLQKWYMVQAGAVDPRARTGEFDDELMGTLIRFVSSHEVGHALGLRHNFGSSSTVPVEKLRDKAWVEANGHTPSIMDYARFNYVAQPEDNISESGLFPRIGDYDKWAIKWAYTWCPQYKTADEERIALAKTTTDSLRKNHRLYFGSETLQTDPRAQNEDLGDNAMLASSYGIKNLKRIISQVTNWVSKPEDFQEKEFKAYEAVWDQFGLYIGHVTKNVGGEYVTFRINSEKEPIGELVPYEIQKSAVKFLNDQLFDTPNWLNDKPISTRLGVAFGYELGAIQQKSIDALLTRARLSRILSNEHSGRGRTYTLNDLFDDLNHGIMKEIYEGKNVDFYRRNMQKLYIFRLVTQAFYVNDMSQLSGPGTFRFTVTDINPILKDTLTRQRTLFANSLNKGGLNDATKLHLKSLIEMIDSKFTAEKSGLLAK